MSKSLPIAVLDTGAGGLSVVNSLRHLLPNEDIYYFADTANLPYGIKSPELISYLSLKMVKKIVEISSCKILVIACHTISVWCLDQIQASVGVPVIGMVLPSIGGMKRLLNEKKVTSIGILSTKATLNSGVYRQAWSLVDELSRVTLVEHASGPLVSLVEEDEDLSREAWTPIISQFIPQAIKQCDALLIGCTHFSALKPALPNVLKPGCEIVDAADLAAIAVRDALEPHNLASKHQQGQFKVYISDNKERFIFIARRFIEGELAVTLINDYAVT